MAKEFAETYLGKDDSITQNLKNIYNRAKGEIDAQIERAQQKQRKIEEVRKEQRQFSQATKNDRINKHTLGGSKRLLAQGALGFGAKKRRNISSYGIRTDYNQ